MRQVVVTTSHRDVWTGETEEDGESGKIRLSNARHIFAWDATTAGVGGLAARGPGPESRIGPPIPNILVRDVVIVMECTEAAAAAIRAQGWGQVVSGRR